MPIYKVTIFFDIIVTGMSIHGCSTVDDNKKYDFDSIHCYVLVLLSWKGLNKTQNHNESYQLNPIIRKPQQRCNTPMKLHSASLLLYCLNILAGDFMILRFILCVKYTTHFSCFIYLHVFVFAKLFLLSDLLIFSLD